MHEMRFKPFCGRVTLVFDDGESARNIRLERPLWANAFNIGTNQNFSSCFFGWDGYCGLNTYNGGGVSNWFTWREDFWQDMAAAAMVSQAVNYANTKYPGPVASTNPTDSNGPYTREQQEEDTMLP